MSRLRLTPRARADLDAIWNYTAERWSIEQAETYLHALGITMSLLAKLPDIGRNIDAISPGYLKFPAASHVIFYRKTGGAIEVVRILHKSLDVEAHL